MDAHAFMENANVWVGLPLAFAGFSIAIHQIRKTRSAAEAAESAAKQATEVIARNHLLVLLPQLPNVETALDYAVEQRDRRLSAYHMQNWRWQAGQLRGLLTQEIVDRRTLSKAIQTSITLAAVAKLDVLDVETNLAQIARPVQEAIAAVTGEVAQLTATYLSTPDGGASKSGGKRGKS